MSTRTLFLGQGYDPVPAGASVTYQAQLVDETGAGMGPLAVNTLTLSIIDTPSGTVIVPPVSILNTGRGTLDAQGNLTVALLPSDTALFNVEDDLEERSLVFQWTYNGGSKVGMHQCDFQLQALST